MHPFRFHTSINGILGLREVTEAARRAESIGYAGILIADHLVPKMAAVPLLTAVAAVTERLRIGTFVLNNGLRHPAVLAHDLATLDVLSGGRLEIGIGAGWNKPEYLGIGLPFPPVGARVSELTEAITVLKGCFGDGSFSFAGTHYTITDYDGQPKPVQRPHPPLFIGGGGRRVLTLAGREADIVGLAPRINTGGAAVTPDARSFTLAAAIEKVSWVRAAAGDRFPSLELNAYPSGGPVIVTNDALTVAADRAAALSTLSGVSISRDEVLESPHIYIGTIDQIAEKMEMLRSTLGVSSFLIDDTDELAPLVERLAGK